jgi:hypothetical protein
MPAKMPPPANQPAPTAPNAPLTIGRRRARRATVATHGLDRPVHRADHKQLLAVFSGKRAQLRGRPTQIPGVRPVSTTVLLTEVQYLVQWHGLKVEGSALQVQHHDVTCGWQAGRQRDLQTIRSRRNALLQARS